MTSEMALTAESEIFKSITPEQKAVQKMAQLTRFMFGVRYREDADDISFHFFVNHPLEQESEVVHKEFAGHLLGALNIETTDALYTIDSQMKIWNFEGHKLLRQVLTIDDIPGAAMVNYWAVRPPTIEPEKLPTAAVRV